jgi:hypothetical protein
MLATVLAAVVLGFTSPAQTLGAHRVGRVIIEGNDQTPDRVILECIPFRPGQRLSGGDLLAAQERLRKCGHFPVNPWRGIGPTVQLLPNELDSEFLDVRIRIQEKPGNWLRFGAADVVTAAALGDAGETCRAGVWLFEHGRRHFFGGKE